MLAATQFDSRVLLSIVLAADGRLSDKLRRDELLPLAAERNLPQLDEKLYVEVFNPEPRKLRRVGARA